MTTEKGTSSADTTWRFPRSDLVAGLLGRLMGRTTAKYAISQVPEPINEIAPSGPRCFFLDGGMHETPHAGVSTGEQIGLGQTLFRSGPSDAAIPCVSPTAGCVSGIRDAAHLRGGQQGKAVFIDASESPAEAESPPLAPLDGPTSSPEALRQRFDEAGITCGDRRLTPLGQLLAARDYPTLIILAADREPGLTGASQLLRENPADALQAATLMGRAYGAKRLCIATLAGANSGGAAAGRQGDNASGGTVEWVTLPSVYPNTLDPMVAHHCGSPSAPVVTLETALACLSAVRDGRVQTHKVMTVIGPKGDKRGNYRVPLGSTVEAIFEAVGIKTHTLDTIIAGGPMRGYSQVSTGAAIDAAVDGLMLIRARDHVPYSDEPCINCGDCIDVCPVNLQAHAIARYAEFSLFDRAADCGLHDCIDCGLCATVCVARRPLLQFIELAKHELAKATADVEPCDDTDAERAGIEVAS